MYYIIYLYMFRAILCSSSGGQNCIFTASGIVTLCKRPCSARPLTDRRERGRKRKEGMRRKRRRENRRRRKRKRRKKEKEEERRTRRRKEEE
jgi:hypothetical protein